ncbi:Putative transposable element [Caligus rogercresseyi]|uniref:Transposable element n=1 Tax=Caligus rogercresseyi TaxID=217165 RepID=A0A7T8QWG5_CALRO|nr:Putative transposable element [Caligus rogercresseyi]
MGFVTSNSIAGPLIWFPTEFRLKAADYIKVLKTKFLPKAPAHTALTAQNWLKKHVEFWPKDMWPPYSSDAKPLDYAFWPHVQSQACTLRHANVETTKLR